MADRIRLYDRISIPNRWEVWQDGWGDWIAFCEDSDGMFETHEFKTHAEAIAYADRMARTNQGDAS